jgi:hypothetical protein
LLAVKLTHCPAAVWRPTPPHVANQQFPWSSQVTAVTVLWGKVLVDAGEEAPRTAGAALNALEINQDVRINMTGRYHRRITIDSFQSVEGYDL